MHLSRVTLVPEEYPNDTDYPFNVEALRGTRELDFVSPVSFFVGENGSGKSSLLKALCRKCGIHMWHAETERRFQRSPFEDSLHAFLSVTWTDGPVPGSFFASEAFRDFAQYLDEWAVADPALLGYFGGRSLMNQSHGQSLMSLFKARYRIKGLYLLDEPETALSPKSQLELLGVLKQMADAGHAQFIVATHSPILMACPGATIFSFDHIPVTTLEYEDTEHYRLYRDFMQDPRAFLGRG